MTTQLHTPGEQATTNLWIDRTATTTSSDPEFTPADYGRRIGAGSTPPRGGRAARPAPTVAPRGAGGAGGPGAGW